MTDITFIRQHRQMSNLNDTFTMKLSQLFVSKSSLLNQKNVQGFKCPYLRKRRTNDSVAKESTLVGRLKANDQKFGLCQRFVSSADQYPFIFTLYYGQRPVNDRPVEIDLFGRSKRLVLTTKQSSDRPSKNIRHVKYFAQKPQRPIDSLVTLDIQGSIFIFGSQKNILLAH